MTDEAADRIRLPQMWEIVKKRGNKRRSKWSKKEVIESMPVLYDEDGKRIVMEEDEGEEEVEEGSVYGEEEDGERIEEDNQNGIRNKNRNFGNRNKNEINDEDEDEDEYESESESESDENDNEIDHEKELNRLRVIESNERIKASNRREEEIIREKDQNKKKNRNVIVRTLSGK